MHACTAVTESFVPQLRVLASSFLEHHPGGSLTAVVVDDDDAHERWRDEPFEALPPAAIGIDPVELARLRMVYEAGAFACSLKPHTLRHLATSGRPALHLDADCLVLGDLSELPALADRHGVVLTAHSLAPAPIASELSFIRWGTFNAGVLAVGPSGLPFLDWWAERCGRHGRTEVAPDVQSDQFWLALVPALFDSHVLRDPGVNVSGWSLHDRDVTWDGDRPAFAAAPLRCFHFCGVFDPRHPLDYHPDGGRPQLGTPIAERPGAARICERYARLLLDAGYGRPAPPYRFGQLPDGTPLTPLMRSIYRRALTAAEQGLAPEPPNPFADDDATGFLDWLASPEPGSGRLSRYLMAVRAARQDVVEAFPAVPGSDEAGYARWIEEATLRGEIEVPAALLPAT